MSVHGVSNVVREFSGEPYVGLSENRVRASGPGEGSSRTPEPVHERVSTRAVSPAGGGHPPEVSARQGPEESGPEEFGSGSGMVERVLAGIDTVGSVPAEVSVYFQPMGRNTMTDVVVRETDRGDGTRKVSNRWEGGTTSVRAGLPGETESGQNGIGSSGLKVGAYEDSRSAAREAYMMFQGLKVNQTV